jgi:hypothetical protein
MPEGHLLNFFDNILVDFCNFFNHGTIFVKFGFEWVILKKNYIYNVMGCRIFDKGLQPCAPSLPASSRTRTKPSTAFSSAHKRDPTGSALSRGAARKHDRTPEHQPVSDQQQRGIRFSFRRRRERDGRTRWPPRGGPRVPRRPRLRRRRPTGEPPRLSKLRGRVSASRAQRLAD